MAPAASLAGRHVGMDFGGKDGRSMYHGDVVPGFPRHPHRGFETITVMRSGLIDHSDSLGATARFGPGDAQWMTAGAGIVHSEMFPLVEQDSPNPSEFFQIWLNLPAASKAVDPYFSMFWSEEVPRYAFLGVDIAVIAGGLPGMPAPPAPPPDSWAARPGSDVAIWTIQMEPGATWTIPPAEPGTNRMLYFFGGDRLSIGGQDVPLKRAVALAADRPAPLECGEAADLLLLQGRPIGEPVVQRGPFVMNTAQEIQQAFVDYRRTQFGGWPWRSDGPVHDRSEGRFAVYADGRRTTPAR